MNIESQTLNKTTKSTEASQKSAASNSKNVSQTADGKSFKGELNSIKATDSNLEKDSNLAQDVNLAAAQITAQVSGQAGAPNADGSNSVTNGAVDKKVLSGQKSILKTFDKDNKNSLGVSELDESGLFAPLNELNSKIATINELKKDSLKSQRLEKDELETSLNYNVIKMDRNDALFFVNLVNGDTLKAQGAGVDGNKFSEIKSEATQSASKVSATLMDALSESMKTNKPFRIDFDKDIAVILRVDKEGKVSAEFIPGDKAVEQYLKNNIPLLKESFDKQNLQYNDLSYQKQKQQQQQQQNNNRKEKKENDDE
jgi:hypothetical protein